MDGHNETDWESINLFSLKNFDVKSKEEREREGDSVVQLGVQFGWGFNSVYQVY